MILFYCSSSETCKIPIEKGILINFSIYNISTSDEKPFIFSPGIVVYFELEKVFFTVLFGQQVEDCEGEISCAASKSRFDRGFSIKVVSLLCVKLPLLISFYAPLQLYLFSTFRTQIVFAIPRYPSFGFIFTVAAKVG